MERKEKEIIRIVPDGPEPKPPGNNPVYIYTMKGVESSGEKSETGDSEDQ